MKERMAAKLSTANADLIDVSLHSVEGDITAFTQLEACRSQI